MIDTKRASHAFLHSRGRWEFFLFSSFDNLPLTLDLARLSTYSSPRGLCKHVRFFSFECFFVDTRTSTKRYRYDRLLSIQLLQSRSTLDIDCLTRICMCTHEMCASSNSKASIYLCGLYWENIQWRVFARVWRYVIWCLVLCMFGVFARVRQSTVESLRFKLIRAGDREGMYMYVRIPVWALLACYVYVCVLWNFVVRFSAL